MTAEPGKQPTPSKDGDRPTPAPPMRTLASYERPDVRRVISNLKNL